MAGFRGSQKHPCSHGMQDDSQVQVHLSALIILQYLRRGALQRKDGDLQL